MDRARLAVAPLPLLRLLALRLLALRLLPLLPLLPLLRLLPLLPLLRLLPLRLLPLLVRRVPLDPLALARVDLLRPDELPELEPLLLAWGIASSLGGIDLDARSRAGERSTSYPFERAMRARRRAYRNASGVR